MYNNSSSFVGGHLIRLLPHGKEWNGGGDLTCLLLMRMRKSYLPDVELGWRGGCKYILSGELTGDGTMYRHDDLVT